MLQDLLGRQPNPNTKATTNGEPICVGRKGNRVIVTTKRPLMVSRDGGQTRFLAQPWNQREIQIFTTTPLDGECCIVGSGLWKLKNPITATTVSLVMVASWEKNYSNRLHVALQSACKLLMGVWQHEMMLLVSGSSRQFASLNKVRRGILRNFNRHLHFNESPKQWEYDSRSTRWGSLLLTGKVAIHTSS